MTLGNNNDTHAAANGKTAVDKPANGNTPSAPANGVRKVAGGEQPLANAVGHNNDNGGAGARAISNKQVDSNTAFLRAARAGDLDRLIQFLETGEVGDINACNMNGLTALHLAAKDGHLEIVRELLARGAAVDNTTKKGNSALHIASLAGQRDVIKMLVQHGADVNRQSQNGFTPLYMAAQENHDTSVRYLLAKGSNQSLATEDGFTPLAVAMQQGHDRVVAVLLESDSRGKVRLPALHIAAKKDDTKAAALLLDNDHNPDVSSKSGFTPLHIAAHYGNLAVANLLLAKGADVNYTAKHNITPMHVACKWGKTAMVELLVARGASIDATTRDGLTPLHCAARSGHEQVIDMLAENHANILAKTKNGLAPLHMAAQGEHVDAGRILLYHKAPVDEVTVDYLTALHVAAHCGHVKVAKLLLDRNADPNARALNGFTPLHIACKKNRIKVVELLLKHGASKAATTESGLTPLHVASFMGCMNIVIYLLQHDASADVPTVRGETPLHLAARANQTDIIRILLRNGANVDARAREEQTPLHVASRLGNVDIVMLLLQHGANIDSTTKDQYSPLHIAAKEGQEEVATILLENGAQIAATTKKGFTPLHLAAKYGHLNVATALLNRDAPINVQGKNGVTPLHVAAHYDHQAIALLLLDRGASTQAAANNGHTPLHIAAKKNQMDVASSLLAYHAPKDAESKSGFTPIHLAAQEGHRDMTALLLEHEAHPDRAARNGLTPLHLCAQEDKVDVAAILMQSQKANIDAPTKAGFTPLHVAAHFGQINMVRYLLENDAAVEKATAIGYTPLHQAAQQGHTLIINLLLKHKADPNALTQNGQTALNIAHRLGYVTVVEVLKIVTETSIVQTEPVASGGAPDAKYKVVAPESMHETFLSDSEDEGADPDDEHDVANAGPRSKRPPVYFTYYQSKPSSSEDPGMSDQQQYKYMTVDDIKGLDDEQHRLDTSGEKTAGSDDKTDSAAPHIVEEFIKSDHHHQMLLHNPAAAKAPYENLPTGDYPIVLNGSSLFPRAQPDNVDIIRHPINVGDDAMIIDQLEPHLQSFGGRRRIVPMCRERFLVSFLVDARGGAMRGCRHSGVRVIVPPRSAAQPTRITCRYVKPQRMPNAPPLMEGEALVSRILELAPVSAKFLGPVIIEVPHFGSLRDKEREIIILRSDNGETWREHTLVDSEEAIQDVLNDSFEAHELSQLDDLPSSRIIRIVTHDFPHYFAVVSRIRQEVHAIGPDGGTVSSAAVPQVQAVFPPNALTKKIRVGLQAQPIDSQTTANQLGRGVAVSPVVTVEPRRRKFHRAITLSMPAPRAHTQGMINQYSGTAPTLRLLCSITGGQNRAVWEDVTGSTPLTFVNDCVSFTTTVSARFWLMDCRVIGDACRMASELYTHMAYVPFMVKFVVFAKRSDEHEAKLSVFCMTDDKEDKTLEQQEHFTEVAKSRDVEILEGRPIYLEFGGALVPILKSGDQLNLTFGAFKENRLTFTVKVRPDAVDDGNGLGRISFMDEPKVAKGEPPLQPVCTLNIGLPEKVWTAGEMAASASHDFTGHDERFNNGATPLRVTTTSKYSTAPTSLALALANSSVVTPVNDDIHKADIRLSDICNLVADDWPLLADALDVQPDDVATIRREFEDRGAAHQAMVMLRLWLRTNGREATGNQLEGALHSIGRSDVVEKCIFNLELVTDEMEREAAKRQLHHDQSGFGDLRDELGDEEEAGGGATNRDAPRHNRVTFDTPETLLSPRAEHEDDDDDDDQEDNRDAGSHPDGTAQHRMQADNLLRLGGHRPNGVLLGSGTPPPSPADFASASGGSPLENEVASRAEAERMDLTLQLEEHEARQRDELESQREDMVALCNGGEEAQNTDSVEDEDSAEAAINRQLAAAAHLEQIEADIADIVAEAQQHVDQVKASQASTMAVEQPPTPLPVVVERVVVESRIPIAANSNAAGRTTTPPSKVKTIKKHSKIQRDATKPSRPTVEDIEWEPAQSSTSTSSKEAAEPAERITEISTLQLEDVTSPNVHEYSEPVLILSPGDEYSGEIDEVILVQTPGDDGDVEDGDDGDTDAGFSPQRRQQRIEDEVHHEDGVDSDGNNVRRTTTLRTIIAGPEVRTVTQTTVVRLSGDGSRAPPPQLTFSTDDDVPTISFSMHSSDGGSDDDDDEGVRIVEEIDAEVVHPVSSSATSIVSEVAPSSGAGGQQPHVQHPEDKMTTTFGSSSGSDVALHEAGAEPSDDDEPGSDFYQSNELGQLSMTPQHQPHEQRRTTTKTTTTVVTSGGGEYAADNVEDAKHMLTSTTTKTSVVKETGDDDEDGPKTTIITTSTKSK